MVLAWSRMFINFLLALSAKSRSSLIMNQVFTYKEFDLVYWCITINI